MKNGNFTLFVDVSLANKMCKQNCEHSLGDFDILPLSCKCKPHKISNFKFSENLRPKMPLIDPGPFILKLKLKTYNLLNKKKS